MERQELLRHPEWYVASIQNDLYKIIYEYMEENKLKKKDVALKLGVSKGYITQILKGSFDHKISKLVELSLAFGKAPIVNYRDLEQYIQYDAAKIKLVSIPSSNYETEIPIRSISNKKDTNSQLDVLKESKLPENHNASYTFNIKVSA